MTVDIQQFSNKLAEIYSNIAKPVLDVMYVHQTNLLFVRGLSADLPDCTIINYRETLVPRAWYC